MPADEFDTRYWEMLAEIVAHSHADGVTNFDDLLSFTAGAFPSDVLKVARQLSINLTFSETDHAWEDRVPNPSPAHGEFYFTSASARALSELVGGATLCLGTPSVALEIARRGRSVTLVDSSAWLTERFGPLDTAIEYQPGLEVESWRRAADFDSAILDPPWYFPALPDWISVASAAVKQGGKIYLPLIPRLSRPRADQDAKDLIALGETVGRVRILDMTVSYESPIFERRAIERAGGRVGRPWRRSPVLEIDNLRPSAKNVSRASDPEWVDRRIGNSIVSVRSLGADSSSGTDEFFRLDTVSRRDERISRANVWTSESTGARLRDPSWFVESLDRAQNESRTRAGEELELALTRLELNQ